jgi:hypothetical protein
MVEEYDDMELIQKTSKGALSSLLFCSIFIGNG